MNPNEWEWIGARAVWSQPPVDVGGIACNIRLALLHVSGRCTFLNPHGNFS